MPDLANDPIRATLRQVYDKYAKERNAKPIEEWKFGVRASFLSRLTQEGKKKLLEIGAGPGQDSKYFHELAFEVTCIDLSPEMVALCQQKGLNALVMDIGDLQFAPDSFDAVYAMNSLLHLPKAEFPGILRRIHGLLKPGGLFFLGIYGGAEHEGIWANDTYLPQRFFSFYSDPHILQEVGNVFSVLSFETIETVPGDPIHFQSLVLRKGQL
jgi:SAM-dependent methyltransferase